MKTVWILLINFFLHAINGQPYQIGCKNEQGEPVDWFIIYKLPRLSSSTDPQIKKGFAYLYMDPSSQGQWKKSDLSIQNKNQSVGFTLNQFYTNKNNVSVFSMLYNDEWPRGNVSFTKGHTKGALVFDSSSGFWLIHSVPKFPPKDSYAYPSTGAKYGQTFFCLTFPYTVLNDLANQLFLNEPYIYYSLLPTIMARENEILVKVVRGQTQKVAPFFRQTILNSLGGIRLRSFAKHKKWGEELYTDLVASQFQSNLFTETWQNGRGDIGSNCTAQYRVYNIANVSLISDVTFSNHDDHSKWAITNSTANENQNWICIGDINRQKEQFFRSGGTMCMQNAQIWKTFYDSIKRYQRCSNDRLLLNLVF